MVRVGLGGSGLDELLAKVGRGRRPRAALDGGTPDMVYFAVPLQREAG
jgi:hypothetical protein